MKKSVTTCNIGRKRHLSRYIPLIQRWQEHLTSLQLYVTLRREDKFWKPKSLGLKIALEKYVIRYVLVISIRFPPFKPITDFFILRDFKVAYLKNSCYIYARFTKKLARFTKYLARFTKTLRDWIRQDCMCCFCLS